MKKIIILHIFIVLLSLGLVSQTFAATVAEASTGHDTFTVGKYDLSNMTDEEREWFATFLNGNLFADGWEQISIDIISNTKPHEREHQQVKLYELGFKIGSEWCKGNDSRRIDTSMLRKWGKELKLTAEKTPHLLSEVLHQINEEVEKLIN